MVPSRRRYSSSCVLAIVFSLLCLTYYLVERNGLGVARLAFGSETVPENFSDPNFPNAQSLAAGTLNFRFFDDLKIYGPTDNSAVRQLEFFDEQQLQVAKETAFQYLLHKGSAVAPGDFLSGRYRWLPEGVEYDVLYQEGDDIVHRVTMFHKLQDLKVVSASVIREDKVVNIIMPLKGRLDKLTVFLDHLLTNVLPRDKYLSLTVVYFHDEEDMKVESLLQEKLTPVSWFKWKLVTVRDEFSRGKGIQIGVRESEEFGPLMFFCDVDILMHASFFSRCRSNTKKGYQVYYPVVFSLYNPQVVYPVYGKYIPPVSDQLVVDESTGFWRHFGFGMTCMFRSEYHSSGGIPDLSTWGSEDEILFSKFLGMQDIKVIRSAEPSLFHVYHHKDCSKVTGHSYPACLRSKASNEGSQLELGILFQKLHEGVDIEGILNKRFYTFWLIPILAILLVISVGCNITQSVLLFKHARWRRMMWQQDSRRGDNGMYIGGQDSQSLLEPSGEDNLTLKQALADL